MASPSSSMIFYFGSFPFFKYVLSIFLRATSTGNVDMIKNSAGTTNNDTTKTVIEKTIVHPTLIFSFVVNAELRISHLRPSTGSFVSTMTSTPMSSTVVMFIPELHDPFFEFCYLIFRQYGSHRSDELITCCLH